MTRLAQFMQRIAADTYPEPPSDGHTAITQQVLADVIPKLPKACAVLDVGCGQGPALRIFRENQIDAIGITLNDEDLKACEAIGLNAVKMDQNDLTFPDSCFDLVWARHVLEHSVAPYWTLQEFRRVLKPNALLYLEVPAPDTDCRHETNQNHYSVLGERGWISLILRAKFRIEEGRTWTLGTPVGPDKYFSFLCTKV